MNRLPNGVGLDTLKIRLLDFDVRPNPDLDVRRPDINGSTGELIGENLPLWRDERGAWVYGARAFHNAPTFQARLALLGGGEAFPTPGAVGCWVELSVPKLGRPDGLNVSPLDGRATVAALRSVGKSLDAIGIKTNIGRAVLSRVDVFRNVSTDEPLKSYAPIFRLLNVPRSETRDYGSTFLYSNGEQKTRVYDKRAEMAIKAKRERRSLDLRGVPSNLLRFEHGLEKARGVKSAFGFETVGELCANFDSVEAVFKSKMRARLFKHDVGDVEAMCVSELGREMMVFRENFGRNWQQRYFMAKGTYSVTQTFGPEVMRAALLEVTGAKSHDEKRGARRMVKQLEQAALDAALLQSVGPKKRLSDLYSELQEKVLG